MKPDLEGLPKPACLWYTEHDTIRDSEPIPVLGVAHGRIRRHVGDGVDGPSPSRCGRRVPQKSMGCIGPAILAAWCERVRTKLPLSGPLSGSRLSLGTHVVRLEISCTIHLGSPCGWLMVRPVGHENTLNGGNPQLDLILQSMLVLGQRLIGLEQKVAEIHEVILAQRVEKEWYTTTELAEALNRSQYTIQERWCNDGRIECEKDPESGKWRISGEEFRRLIGGGSLKPKRT
jgi:hypothetical protein